jgi:hypothetical protein
MYAIGKLDVKASADTDKIAKLYLQLVIVFGRVETETWETRVTRGCACNDQRSFGNDILWCVRAETMWEVEYMQQTEIYKSKDAARTWKSDRAFTKNGRDAPFNSDLHGSPSAPVALLQAFQHAPSLAQHAPSLVQLVLSLVLTDFPPPPSHGHFLR